MSFLIYLVLFSICSSLSTSFQYRIIRNATIQLPFDIPNNLTHQKPFQHCDDCLCEASNKSEVHLFTCNGNITMNFICQFYYFMPKIDELYLSNNTDIYIMKENGTFEEKDDCCDTEFLVKNISNTNKTYNPKGPSRFLVRVDNNTIISTSVGEIFKINQTTLDFIRVLNITSVKTVGYNDKKYYFNNGTNLVVYDETLTSPIYPITLNKSDLTAIRFINKNQMLVGTNNGAYIFEKQDNETNFQNYTLINETSSQNIHAFGIIDENTFYVGNYYYGNLDLYIKNQNNSWIKKINGTITRNESTSDIFVDKCKRIWAVNPIPGTISIYEQNKNSSHKIETGKKAFGLLILENYTLILTHDDPGLTSIKPSLNCRP